MNNKVKKKNVSYSQFSTYLTCQYKYYLDYIKNLRKFEDNIYMSFGNAIHETIQTYLRALYKKSDSHAQKMDMFGFFELRFKKELTQKKILHTPEQYTEFVEDGKYILQEFRQIDNRLKYFPTGEYELLDIEHEIKIDIKNNVELVAYLDLVLKDKKTGKIKIIDFKTSTRGWSSEKEDLTKIYQLILYKAIYSKKYNIPLDMINVEFFIVKRKVYENSKFMQNRIDVFKPNAEKENVNEAIQEFSKFVDRCFTPDGKYKEKDKFFKVPGKNNKNCRYCNYLGDKCNGVADII